MKLAYLSTMFLKLNEVNLQLQGINTHLLHLADKITSSFIRKPDTWLQRVKVGRVEPEIIHWGQQAAEHSDLMHKAHICALQKHFQRYFLMQDPKKYDWIRDPFSASPPADLSTSEEEEFIDVTSDSTLRMQFQAKTLAAFWIGVEKEHWPQERAVTTPLPFTQPTYVRYCRVFCCGLHQNQIQIKAGEWEWTQVGNLKIATRIWCNLQHEADPRQLLNRCQD